MIDRSQPRRFCSCSANPPHIADSDFSASSASDDRDATGRSETRPADGVESERVRFCTCSDAPTRLAQDAGEIRDTSGEVGSSAAGPSQGVIGSAATSEAQDGVAVSLDDLPELASLTELLPGETSLYSAFTHGEDGSEALLTDRRILLRGAPDASVLFSSVRLTDVDSVSISRARPNRRSLIWGLIGLGATVGMWQALDGVGNLRLIIAAIVLLMSAVLLADYALRPPDLQVVIRAKSGADISIDFAQNRADAADRFSAKVVAALEAIRAS